MNFDEKLYGALKTESESVAVRQAVQAARYALIARSDVMSESARIAHWQKDDNNNEVSPEMRSAAKRHAMNQHTEKHRDYAAKLQAAEADIARRLPPIENAATPGDAQVDAELRQHFRSLPEAKRMAPDTLSDAMKLAIARAPAELSGMSPAIHARVQDGVRRARFPEAMQRYDADRQVLASVRLALDAHRETAKSAFTQRAPVIGVPLSGASTAAA